MISNARQQAGDSARSDKSSHTRRISTATSIYHDIINDVGAEDFEPVEDNMTSLPGLYFKPLILREGTLISILIFYLGLISGVGVLYHYENTARSFHVHATASRFTIRILPSLIGTVSTMLYQSVVSNFARLLPYIAMAAPSSPRDKFLSARQTLLAAYFPLVNLGQIIRNRRHLLMILVIVTQFLNPFITPAKSILIQKKSTKEDPTHLTISISGPAAIYLLFNYCVIVSTISALLLYLWNRRTGLKWDPISLADHMMLLHNSDLLKDFCGLEYHTNNQFKSLESQTYRLGYWRHRQSSNYWHGIRKWPPVLRTVNDGDVEDNVPSPQQMDDLPAQWPLRNDLISSKVVVSTPRSFRTPSNSSVLEFDNYSRKFPGY